MDKNQWLEFIDRKINREYSRKSYSGITKWALLLAFFALSNSYINSFLVQLDNHLYSIWYYIVVVIEIDIVSIVMMSFSSIAEMFKERESVYFTSKLMSYSYYFIFRAIAIISSIVFILNIVLLVIASGVIRKGSFIAAAMVFLLIAICNFSEAHKRKQQISRKSNVPLIDGIPRDYSQPRLKTFFMIVILIGSFALCRGLVYSCSFPGDSIQLIQVIITDVKIVGCIILLFMMLCNSYKDNYIDTLEAFERLILINDYDSDKIFSFYGSLFIGFHLKEWIEVQRKKIEDLNKMLDGEYQKREKSTFDEEKFTAEKNRRLIDLHVEIISGIKTVIDDTVELIDEKSSVELTRFQSEMKASLKNIS